MSTTSPATPAPVRPGLPPAPTRSVPVRRRPALMGLGAALVALGALGAWWLASSVGQTVPVLAVSTQLARGEVVQAADLSVVAVPAGPSSLASIPESSLAEVVGQVATVDLLAGSLLTPAAVAEGLTPAAGTSLVGVALTSTQRPTSALRAGDRVRLVETPVNQGDPPVESPGTITATVVVTAPIEGTDSVVVNVEVPSSDAAALAARAATGRVALVLDPPAGG